MPQTAVAAREKTMERARSSRIFAGALVATAVVVLALVARPLASALFLGAVLAGIFHGLFQRLARRLGGRPMLASGLVTLGVLVGLLVPVAALLTLALRQMPQALTYLERTFSPESLAQHLHHLPGFLGWMGDRVAGALPDPSMLLREKADGGQAVATVSGVLTATTALLIDVGLTFVAFFVLLVDGPKLVTWLDRIVPLEPGRFRSLLREFRKVTNAVLVSSAAMAALQAITALIGYGIAGVPNPLFFALLTLFLALVPAVGAASVSLVLALVYFLEGRTGGGLFLLGWGLLAVGLIDNLFKPLLIRNGVQLHGAVIFFSLIGGLAAFGAVGVVAGPLAVAFFIAVTRMQPLVQPAGRTPAERETTGRVSPIRRASSLTGMRSPL